MSVQAVRRPLFLAFALVSVAHANTNTLIRAPPPTHPSFPSPPLPSQPHAEAIMSSV